MHVQVANGQLLQCTHHIVACPMWISGHPFQLSLKVLPLNCYDIILGMDWLEQHSPMQVDWKEKTMSFEYQGGTTILQGILAQVKSCAPISYSDVVSLAHQDQIWCLLELYKLDVSTDTNTSPYEIQ